MNIHERKRQKSGRRLKLALLILVIVAAYFFLHQADHESTSEKKTITLTAVKITDGDTFTASNGEIIRLLGVDTPERGEPYYEEATQYLYQLAYGKQLEFETDKRGRDHYGRLLAYVFAEGQFVNLELLKAGLASVYIFPKDMNNTDYKNRFIKAQKDARVEGRGIWSLKPRRIEKEYIGNKKTLRFHRPSCRSVTKLREENRISFPTREDFLDRGYSACRNCKP